MSGTARRAVPAVVLATTALLLGAAPALAHSYADPALTTVLDGVQPSVLPASVVVAVRPSVVDELVVSNPTVIPLDVVAVGGEPFLRVDRTGVLANLASPDWYLTGNPEGGAVPPADVLRDKGKAAPRWARVSRVGTWAEFDPRLHPPTTVSPQQRAAAKDLVVATWRIPLRYGSTPLAATGHVSFTPIRGGFVTAVTAAPKGIVANALQGELPGVLLQVPAGRTVVVLGAQGEPFLRFSAGAVEANTSSPSWVADQRARGNAVPPAGGTAGVHWQRVAAAPSFSWLDSRLRYPADQPPADVVARSSASVVRRWSVPLIVDGTAAALDGTDTWVPRAVATRQITGEPSVAPAARHRTGLLLGGLTGLVLVAVAAGLAVRRRRT